MKKKVITIIIIAILIVLAFLAYKLFIKNKENDNKKYIIIECSISPGITDQYIPPSNYIIYRNGKVEYIPNVDENKKEKLKTISKSELKEIYGMIINSSEPINNGTINPRGRRRMLQGICRR